MLTHRASAPGGHETATGGAPTRPPGLRIRRPHAPQRCAGSGRAAPQRLNDLDVSQTALPRHSCSLGGQSSL